MRYIKNKAEILENIKDKDEKIAISNILDKAIKFEKINSPYCSNFFNLSEMSTIKKILDYLKINYTVFSPNKYVEKKNIAFIPDYFSDNEKIFLEHISCIKIIPKSKGKLIHKDYMGAIYSLGIKREFIGDIIVKEDFAYFFCMKSVEEFFLINLLTIGKYEVDLELVDLFSDEVKLLSVNMLEKVCIIPSLRVDALLSEVYNLSRSETKAKIVKGDLFINDKNIFYPNTIISLDDIVSFKKCGKMRIGEVLRNTKSGNIVINVFKYN